MFPDKATALRELELAGRLNVGQWVAHSKHVAEAARLIAEAGGKLDANKAFVCGLLHDIGRRTGMSALRHAVDGFDYAMSQGWDEVARICLTHVFPVRDMDAYAGERDISDERQDFIRAYLNGIAYDDYDKLIILCDALGEADGFCILEKRFIDVARRYGIGRASVERWNRTFEYKEYFEKMTGQSIYALLPGIEQCIYR